MSNYYKDVRKARKLVNMFIKTSPNIKFIRLYGEVADKYGLSKKWLKGYLDELKDRDMILFEKETYNDIVWCLD